MNPEPNRKGAGIGFACQLLLILLLFPLGISGAMAQVEAEPGWLGDLLEKEHITIVVTDSGLGGLSILADAAEKFRQYPVFKEVDLVFVNALFRDQGGYNSLQTREEKLAVFSAALQGMHDRYQPDLILVACNTLSVLVPDTRFAQTSSTPVAGIVELGVEQIAARLQDDPAARNIIFATQTTVDEGAHKQQLIALGIGQDQVMAQSCPQLSMYIEQGFDGMDTEMLIDAYVDEALSRAGEIGGPLSVSFNCTHFGYALPAWKLAFESRGVEVEAYLDPNTRMVDFLLPEDMRQRFPLSDVSVKVVSMVEIAPASMDSIGRYLHEVSPLTETALRNVERLPGLFEWRSLVAGAEE
ncbi:MAG: aspartate/glutamate racemase family protein [Xanthomonadales bacterium]|nr:aspartate/glutamate racemase family protein [Xanthomonadales bacterium]